ncbi:dynamin family protein [Pendulispora albinea]|uniref:Dynamin family protein n=1 Tax=Pendulispora albinea TaxID=2741071 RepID=A0ABZ2M3X0_9BACT
MRLFEIISRWMGRVEVVLAGADEELRAGEDALASGDAMLARALAHAVLKRLPGSLLGLALLADACEAAGLDAELALTLEELAGLAGSNAEVWVRLARARQKTMAPADEVRDTLVRALAVAGPGSDARREALLSLADLDLAQGDGARAELWLERLADRRSPEVALRRAEARLAQHDVQGAHAAIEEAPTDPTHGRAELVRGRILAVSGDKAAFVSLIRAYVLEVPGASELLASTLAWAPSDDAIRARVRLVVEHRGETKLARWRAAFARADGRRDEARAALRDALESGDRSAAHPLLDAALEDGDPAGLEVALAALDDDPDPVVADARKLPDPAKLGTGEELAPLLDHLATVTEGRAKPWAEAVRKQIALRWIPPSGDPAAWGPLLARLDRHAQTLHDLESTARLSELSAERSRPVRVAIVGEFNAGKSTFINALMGKDVAPTGVLPTTATLHHLRYASDPIARIWFEPEAEGPRERIVPVSELRATLKTVAHATIRRVEILLPLPSLTRVEVIDTPGFNAPDVAHGKAARAAFEEADAVIWLFDAGQALKQSERLVLDEAKAARIPVQILVNKADRLTPSDLAKVMERVAFELGELGVTSWTAPRALSARLALAGRLGDAQALAASGWADVQALLDEHLVGRSTELKERALRRRAASIVARLRERALGLANDENDRNSRAAQRAKIMARLAASLDRDTEDIARALGASLEPALQAWQGDLSVVVTGRDRDAVSSDPVLMRYRVERALARLAPPLADAMAAVARDKSSRIGASLGAGDGDGPPLDPGITPSELAPLARALVRQLAFTGATSSHTLARAALGTLIEHASARATPELRTGAATWLERELFSFSEALG